MDIAAFRKLAGKDLLAVLCSMPRLLCPQEAGEACCSHFVDTPWNGSKNLSEPSLHGIGKAALTVSGLLGKCGRVAA
ncbi:MAG: hypothetical protein DUD39_07500 [Coriobacteriaceae bacterium]|nr:MAG: hypothetical protein DUD39_07500 [Coriobacteriaceae bacterium]